MAYREKDYIKRQIDMCARLLALVLARVLGAKDAGQLDEALEEMRIGAGVALGLEYDTLGRLDPASARALLRDPGLIDAYAQMLELEAGVAARQGEAAQAEALRARASTVQGVAPERA